MKFLIHLSNVFRIFIYNKRFFELVSNFWPAVQIYSKLAHSNNIPILLLYTNEIAKSKKMYAYKITKRRKLKL